MPIFTDATRAYAPRIPARLPRIRRPERPVPARPGAAGLAWVVADAPAAEPRRRAGR